MFIILAALAIVLCIALEWKWHINMGLTAAVCAFLIGCFGLGLAPAVLKNTLPVKIIFPIVSITTFYGFALENGTLIKVVQRVIYRFRNNRGLMPVMLFVMCSLLGIAGMDAGSIAVIMAPIAMSIVSLGDQPMLPYALSVMLGSGIGSNYMFAAGGTIMRGLVEETVFADTAFRISMSIFLHNVISSTLFLIVILLVFRRRGDVVEMEEPAPLDKKQKTNLIMILLFIAVVAIPSILGELSGSKVLLALAKKLDVSFVALIFALIACFLRLGDITSIIKTRIPWKTLFMVSGITMLIGVASQAGMTESLANLLGSSCPRWLTVPLITLVAGIMSFFSSAISVVIPTMFPMLPGVIAATGIQPGICFAAVALGSAMTAVSPFSTGGSIVLGSCMDEKKREPLMFGMLVSAFVMLLGVVIYCGIAAMIVS